MHSVEGATNLRVAPERHFDVEFPALDGRQRLDALLRVAGKPNLWLAIELKNETFPRDIKNALWQLDEYARAVKDEKDVVRVVVVHALLHAGGEWINGKELAKKAQTSGFTVSQTLRELERLEWVQADTGGGTARRRLVQPGLLLDAWASAWKEREQPQSRWFAFASNPRVLPDAISAKLQGADVGDWCISGAVAGNALAPLLTDVDVIDLIVAPGQTQAIADAAGAKRAEKGANLVIVERSGASNLFRRSVPDRAAPLASPFIVYLDLLKDDRGRHKELAAQLRSTVLKV